MRSDLSEVAGISSIDADTSTRTCSFRVDLDQVELTKVLTDLGNSNSHIAGWSVKSQEAIENDVAAEDDVPATDDSPATDDASTTDGEEAEEKDTEAEDA